MSEAGASGWAIWEWLQVVERELLLFTLFWFIIGMFDELAVDGIWFWLRLVQGKRTDVVPAHLVQSREAVGLTGRIAVFIPAWQEADVIGTTIRHMLSVWTEADYRIYVGCYANDSATIAAAVASAGQDPRLRLVIHDSQGPTTKADCLNRLYSALCDDEARLHMRFRGVILQDSEDMVHPLALGAIDRALGEVDFVQLPVHPEFPKGSRWVSGHYCDEFTELHAKAMVVRDALGAGLPAAGVGCGFGRAMLDHIGGVRRARGELGPFAAECLTEDYELGMLIARGGGASQFLRLRAPDGELIATRSYFPACLPDAVRQKTRWIHGISLQSWERLGWTRGFCETWMVLRDRRGPLTALVLASAYLLLILEAITSLAGKGLAVDALPPFVQGLVGLGLAGFVWRAGMRAIFTAREYGAAQGFLSVLRIPVANIITIMAGRRAFWAYLRSLRGIRPPWEKTEHHEHPARLVTARVPA